MSDTRDLRIDFLRGLALWMIFADHISGNLVRYVTYHALGFSTAAEIFVFLSGVSSALLYRRLIAERGFGAAQRRAFRRVRQIYLAYLAVAAATIAISRASGYVYDDGYEAMIAAPAQSFLAAAALAYSPGLLGILPLYLPLVAAAPLLVAALARKPVLTLSLSMLLWLAATSRGWNFPAAPPMKGWDFDPLGWQLLFVIGLFAGLQCYGQGPGFRLARGLKLLCWIVVTGNVAASLVAHSGLVFAHVPAAASDFGRYLRAVRLQPTMHWLRLLHFLAVAYLVAGYLPREAAFLRRGWSRVIQLCGRHSLEVFSLGAVLSLLASIYIATRSHSLPAQAAVNGLGWALMAGFALWQSRPGRFSQLPRRVPVAGS